MDGADIPAAIDGDPGFCDQVRGLPTPPHPPRRMVGVELRKQRERCGGFDRPPVSAASEAETNAGRNGDRDQVAAVELGGELPTQSTPPQTAWAVSTTSSSLARCWSGVSTLPSSVDAKPHWGAIPSCSMSTWADAASN